VHHFDAAAGQCEGEGPDGPVASPGDELVDGCPVIELCVSLTLQLRRLPRLTSYTAYSATLIGLTSETAKLGDFTPSVGGLNMPFWRLDGRDWVLPDSHRR